MAFLLGSVTEGLFSGAKNMAALMDEFETAKTKAKDYEYAAKVRAEMDAKRAAAKPKSEGGAPVDTGAGTTAPTSAGGGVDPSEIDKVPTSKHLGGTGEPAKPAAALSEPKTPSGVPESQADSSMLPPGGTALPSSASRDVTSAPTVLPVTGTGPTGAAPEGQQQTGGVSPAAQPVPRTAFGGGAMSDPDSILNRGARAVAGALGFGGAGSAPYGNVVTGFYNPQSVGGQDVARRQAASAAQAAPDVPAAPTIMPSSSLMSTETPPGTRPGLGIFPQRGATPSPTRSSTRPPQQPGIYLTPGSLTGGQTSPAPATAMPTPDMVYDQSTGTWIRRGQSPAMLPR